MLAIHVHTHRHGTEVWVRDFSPGANPLTAVAVSYIHYSIYSRGVRVVGYTSHSTQIRLFDSFLSTV